tara:strand:+ start:3768 stop:6836 length:3069 start_codon:yes stop_codon:yes gene_type:complete
MSCFIKNNTFVFVLILLVANLNAQNFSSQHIGTAEGLPNNQVETILKDSRGILWIGTNNGVSKIENDKITNFFAKDGLAHNNAWSIIEDENAIIWIGSHGGGLTKFDGKTFTIFNEKNGLVNNAIRKLYNYKNYVFVGTENGLSMINTKNDSISTFDTSSVFFSEGINDFQVMDYFIYKDELYACTFRTGIFKLDIENKKVKKIFAYEKKSLFSVHLNEHYIYYGIDTQNFEGRGSLRKFNIDSLLQNKKEEVSFGKSIIWNYAIDNKSNLYGAAWGVNVENGGVYQIKEHRFINRTNDFGIKSTKVRCVFFDPVFNFLYVGTTDMGFYKVDLNENIAFFPKNEMGIIAIESSNSTIALLTKKGLTLVNKNTATKEILSPAFFSYAKNYFKQHPKIAKNIFDFFINSRKVNDITFYSIVYKDKSYWISTLIGMFQLSLEGTFLNYHLVYTNKFDFDAKNRMINPIPYSDLDIVYDLKNYNGFGNRKKGANIYAAIDPNTPVEVSDFVKSNNKTVISTLYKGLFILEDAIIISLKEQNLFNELEINHLELIKSNNTLVISTTSGAVYLADISKDFKILKKIDNKLSNGNTVLFLETYKENILIGTEKGLNIYSNGIFQFIDYEQGLIHRDFTASKITNNKLIIGTHSGYYEINLDKILHPTQFNLEVKAENILINHQDISSENFNWFNYSKKLLALNYDQNSITIDYNIAMHPYPNKLLYRNQVKGLDTTWSAYSKHNNINLHYLPSGNYDINVQTKDLNSGQQEISKLIRIAISPPYWQTWWFRLLTFCVFLLIVYLLYKSRIRNIRKLETKKAKAEKRLVETKLEALQSQMNPHFTFNAMNSIQNFIIDNDIDNALMYLGEFARLIRKTLDNSSQQSISLSEEISYLETYTKLENMRFNNKINIVINYGDLEINDLEIPPMLIQPFVENTFVHAFDKSSKNPMITISFSTKDTFLQCKITDNGKGMSKTSSGQLHQSKGLKLVRERLSLINTSLVNNFEIQSDKNTGTTILLQIQIPSFND